MKCKLVLLFLLWALVSSGAVHHKTNYYSNRDFDYFRLALRWPNSYCLAHDQACKPSGNNKEYRPQNFTISYLRPEKLEGQNLENCGAYPLPEDIMKRHKSDLERFWPSLKGVNFRENMEFWQEQWNKYGSCAGIDIEKYFILAISRTKDHDLKRILAKSGISADGKQYTLRKLFRVLHNALGVYVDIVCETDRRGDNVYLSEIHQCLDSSGTTFVDCFGDAKGCFDDPVFPDIGFTPANYPRP